MRQQPTLLLMPTQKINLLKKAHPQKNAMPTHIAHICLCPQRTNPTQGQSQKSAIANALLAALSFQKVIYLSWLPFFVMK